MVLPLLAVSDIVKSLSFYVDQLGWAKLFGMPGEDGSEMFAMVAMNPAVQFGLSANTAPAPRGSGVVFMGYVSDDVDIDSYYAECKSRGANITEDIRNEYWGDRCFGVTDPDGYVLSICKTVDQKTPEDILAASQNA